MESLEKIAKAKAGSKCQREVRLDQAGKPVYCQSKASLVVRGLSLCQKHAKEQMDVIASQK